MIKVNYLVWNEMCYRHREKEVHSNLYHRAINWLYYRILVWGLSGDRYYDEEGC